MTRIELAESLDRAEANSAPPPSLFGSMYRGCAQVCREAKTDRAAATALRRMVGPRKADEPMVASIPRTAAAILDGKRKPGGWL